MKNIINIPFSKEAESVWDKTVPIVPQKNITNAYLTSEIAEPSEYNEFCYLLSTASEAETFHIFLNTPGGILDSAFMIVDAINNSKARVVAHLSGCVASAGTIIALACSELIIADHIEFMVHNYSGGIAGKGHEMKARQEFVDASLQKAFHTLYAGFLTKEEMQEVIDGKDMWMGKAEVLSRFKGTFSSKKGKSKKDA